MQLGEFHIDSVFTGIFGLDGGSMFGVVPKALWIRAYDPGDEKNRIPMTAGPLLIRKDGMNILVDTGNGTKMDPKYVAMYGIDIERSNFENNLKPFGLTRHDITHVIFTHLHFDHAGGATIRTETGIEPTFPNARHYVQKEHFEWALNPTEKDRASFMKDDFMPLYDDGLLELVEGEIEILSGIRVLLSDGHTKSMQLPVISGGGRKLIYCADLAPTSAHVKIAYGMGYDNFPLSIIQEKKRIFPKAADEKWILAFEHDAFTQAATIKRGPKDFEIDDKITLTQY